VGRTLLSDAFDFGFGGGSVWIEIAKIKVKGVGQECPTHTQHLDAVSST